MGSTKVRRRGATLIESVVVAGVLSMIVVFTLSVIPSFKMSNRRANMELQAGTIAQSGLEQLRAGSFDEVAATDLPDVTADEVVYDSTVLESDIVSAGAPPKPISKTVRVTVEWKFRGQTYKTFRQSIFCRIPRA